MRSPVAITADVHLHEHEKFKTFRDGYNSRLLDARDAVLEVAAKAKAQGAKTLIIAGDWFHSRKNVSIPCLDVSAKLIRKLRKDFEVYALLGNHDLSLDGSHTSILGQRFTAVWTTPGVYEVDGWKIGVLPWSDVPRDVDKAMKGIAAKKPDFVVGHLGISGAKVGPSDFEMQGHVTLTDIRASVPVFLGHYHKPQSVKDADVHYVGSPLQIDWGEAGEEKSFVLFKSKSDWDRVDLEVAPRFVETTAASMKNDARPQDFVRITVGSKEEASRVRTILDQNAADKDGVVGKVSLHVQRAVEAAPARVDVAGKSRKEQLRAWMEYKAVPSGVDPGEAFKVGVALLGEHS